MLDRVTAEDVQLDRHTLALQRFRLRVELDRREVRDLLDQADDLHWCDPSVRARGALRHPREPARARGGARGRGAVSTSTAGSSAGTTGRRAPGRTRPWPLLRQLPNAIWIRGNGERWLKEPPVDRPEVLESYEQYGSGVSKEEEDWLYGLPSQAELDGILYVHGSPLSDVESFPPEPSTDDERLLAGVQDRTIVFGHSHQQFRRPGPSGTDLVNPGSRRACRSTATLGPHGQPGTTTSSSGGSSTTSSEPQPPGARWASWARAVSASSPRSGS